MQIILNTFSKSLFKCNFVPVKYPTDTEENKYILAPQIFFAGQPAMDVCDDEKLACDIFGLGMILWNMLFGIDCKPFENFDLNQYSMSYDKNKDLWWKHFKNDNPYYNDSDLKNLFFKMFDPFPKLRITTRNIKKHKWYKKIDNLYNGMNGKYNQECFIARMQKMRLRKEIFGNTRWS